MVLPGTLLIGLPLLGVAFAGKRLTAYLEFPPRTYFVPHAPFSWSVFTCLVAVAALLVAVLVLSLWRMHRLRPHPHGMPQWGWGSLLALAVFWALAWSRFDWFAACQAYTFTPLWLSYIVVVNALSWRRQGHCLLTRQRRYLLLLFPFSALFWWYFEFLNRFVQNWHYSGVESFGAVRYAVHSTLCFSTVLPAVVSTMELLQTFLAVGSGSGTRMSSPRALAWLLLVVSAAGLAGLGVWPDVMFPLLWLAPLLLIVAFHLLWGESLPVFRRLPGSICVPALAALICGLFWEMWNYYSLARWTYAVPYVDRFHVFEMPLLGYAGYLPFGVECAVVADLVRRLSDTAPASRA